jgi:CheY-like chemotaxis protein
MLAMHETSVTKAADLVVTHAGSEAVQPTPQSEAAWNDFRLATDINAALHRRGHFVDVTCAQGDVTVFVEKYILRFEHYKQDLTEIITTYPGVEHIDIKFSQDVRLPTISRNLEVDRPSKILLVDDEIEFVHTLSERLKTRSIDSSVVYDGEEALSVIEEEEPDVMVLDLKMPGIDGIEVLRQVKEKHPNVEVIILTGHGSQQEKQIAEELGAFAYLEKPVKIETLTKTMQAAYDKVHQRNA